MVMKIENNSWKITTVILFLIILGLSFMIYQEETATYKIGDFEIKQSQLNEITEALDDKFEVINICRIDTNECIRTGKLK